MKKLQIRFSKQITIICIVMDILITVCIFVLLFLGKPVDGMLAAAIYAPFNIELGFNAFIKAAETKHKKTEGGNETYSCEQGL